MWAKIWNWISEFLFQGDSLSWDLWRVDIEEDSHCIVGSMGSNEPIYFLEDKIKPIVTLSDLGLYEECSRVKTL